MRVYEYVRDTSQQPPPPSAGQLVRAPESDHLIYGACGNTLVASEDGGLTFANVNVQPATSSDSFFHVAVGPTGEGGSPEAVYVLSSSAMFVSLDGGHNWLRDQTPVPAHGGAAVSTFVSTAPSSLIVSPRSALEVFLVVNDQSDSNSHDLLHGDFSQFAATQAGVWTQVVTPPPPNPFPNKPFEDSGCVFLATTKPGRGDLLFLNPLRTNPYVGPLDPASPSEWHQLDQGFGVHVDLHGILLSPDFEAGIEDGSYVHRSGTVWLLSDGGVYKSTDGGSHFSHASNDLSTLAAVNVAGVAVPGSGPALSFNTGDNDGFYSLDGGTNWASQDYGGGDNDCSYADPLRSQSMLVYTPRWGTKLAVYETSIGSLPNAASGTGERHAVPGPPPGSKLNATSGFGERGSRPLILNLPGDDVTDGDYVFILSSPSPSGGTRARVVRTRQLRQISDQTDWLTTTSDPTALVFQEGPDLPDPTLGLLQASGGHDAPVFYAGGNTRNELWKWTAGMAGWAMIVPGAGSTAAIRFFVNPYDPDLVYILDSGNVNRSDDGGKTWGVDTSLEKQLTANLNIPINRSSQSDLGDNVEVVLTDMQFDPFHPTIRFAIGEAGAFYTNDGADWNRLIDTGAVPGRPMNCYYDWISNSPTRALYVSLAGRGLLKLSPLPNDSLTIVPDVVGTPMNAARAEMHAIELVAAFTGSTQPNAWVFSQSPAAGEIVAPHSTVTMYLRAGPIP